MRSLDFFIRRKFLSARLFSGVNFINTMPKMAFKMPTLGFQFYEMDPWMFGSTLKPHFVFMIKYCGGNNWDRLKQSI